ncbi:MAG: hypothetical protein O7B35_17575 [Deltaproteobacteria bacterium]|nr:hypothetical protein [Deltaproteobacteria bacterium]
MEINLQKVLIFALLLSLVLPPLSLRAAEPARGDELQLEPAQPSTGEDLGYGFGSLVASLFYSPLKITYAGLGLMTGGLGYLLSAGKAGVADKIIYPAVYGNYIITPSHLKGAQPLVFIGPPPPTDPTPQKITTADLPPQG